MRLKYLICGLIVLFAVCLQAQRNQHLAIKTSYDSSYMCGKLFVGVKNSMLYLYDPSMNLLSSEPFANFEEWHFPFYKAKRNGNILLYDTNFNLLLSITADEIYCANATIEKNKDLSIYIPEFISERKLIAERNDTLFYVKQTNGVYSMERAVSKSITAFGSDIGERRHYCSHPHGGPDNAWIVSTKVYLIANSEGKIIYRKPVELRYDAGSKDFLMEQLLTAKYILFQEKIFDIKGQWKFSNNITPLYAPPPWEKLDTLVNAFDNYRDTILTPAVFGYRLDGINRKYGFLDSDFNLRFDTIYDKLNYRMGFFFLYKNNPSKYSRDFDFDSIWVLDHNFKVLAKLEKVKKAISFIRDSIIVVHFMNKKEPVYFSL